MTLSFPVDAVWRATTYLERDRSRITLVHFSPQTGAVTEASAIAEAQDWAMDEAGQALVRRIATKLDWMIQTPEPKYAGVWLWRDDQVSAVARPNAKTQSPKRIILSIESFVGDKPTRVPMVENALIGTLKKQGHTIISNAQTRQMRKAIQSALEQQSGLPDAIYGFDADLLVVGQVETTSYGKAYGMTAFEAQSSLRIVKIDTAQILGTADENQRGQGFADQEAARDARTKLSTKLGSSVFDLVESAGSGPVELLVGGIPSLKELKALTFKLKKVLKLSSLANPFWQKKITRITLDAGLPANDLANLIDSESSLPLQLAQISSGQIIASYDVMRDAQLTIAVPKTSVRLPPEDRWLAETLPDVMATELSNLAYLSPEALASPKTTDFGLTSFAKKLKGKKASLTVALYHRSNGKKPLTKRTEIVSVDDLPSAARSITEGIAESFITTVKKAGLLGRKGKLGKRGIQLMTSRTQFESMSGDRLEVTNLDIPPLFAAHAGRYRDVPAGGLTLKNPSESASAEDIRIELSAELLSQGQPLILEVPSLEPGASVDVPLQLQLDRQQVAALTSKSSVTASIKVDYNLEGALKTERRTIAFPVHARNTIDWSTPEAMGAFITPRDPAVKRFARQALAARPPLGDGQPQIRDAATIFEALRAANLTYAKDPSLADKRDGQSLDEVQYPADLLTTPVGDCDDMTALYTSLLESVGIETTLILTPGHILMAFAVDTHPSLATMLDIGPESTLEHEGKLWVPIETTSVKAGFTKAWQSAATHLSRNKKTLIPVAQAWKQFPPYPFALSTGQPPAVASNLQSRVQANLASLKNLRNTYREGSLDKLTKASNGKKAKAKDHNQLGLAHAMAEDLSAAKIAFESGLKRFPRSAELRLNLANVEFLSSGSNQEALEKAVQRYLNLTQDPDSSPETYNNLGLALLEVGDAEGAKNAFRSAIERGSTRLLEESGLIQRNGQRASAETNDAPKTVVTDQLKSSLRSLFGNTLKRHPKSKKGVKKPPRTKIIPKLSSAGRRGIPPEERKPLTLMLYWEGTNG